MTFWSLCVVVVISSHIVLGEKYKIFPAGFSNITWEQARRNCMDIGAGWDLVKIQSKAEDLVIKDMLKCEGDKGVGWFIGGIGRTGVWTYADGTRMTYDALGPMPLGDTMVSARAPFIHYAAIFRSDFAWHYLNPYDNANLGYICEAQNC